jgi:hypothetical protein
MKLRIGQTCAACVSYSDTGTYSWIITKIEKKSAGNKYIVRDEYAENSDYDTYTVESNRIAPFPAANEDYKAGERILALWHDDESNVWSTMFYEATVMVVLGDRKLSVLYKGSDAAIELDAHRITRFPPDFDLHEPDPEPEEKEIPDSPPAATPPAGSPRPSPLNTDDDTSEAQAGHQKMETLPASVEKRRILFMFSKPQEAERAEIEWLSNEDFTSLAGPEKEAERMRIEPGTPLLDSLADPDLFSQDVLTHVTGSGVLSVPGVEPPRAQSILLSGPVRCGRLGWILNEWRTVRK